MSTRPAPHSNVIDLPRRARLAGPTASTFDQLTAVLIMERHRRGELDPAIVEALLAGVGLEVPR